MPDTPRFRVHETLMTRLAEANGVDLDLMMQSGEITPEIYQDAVLNCTGCSDPEACRAQLNQGGTEIPGFCRNGAQMARWAEKTPFSQS